MAWGGGGKVPEGTANFEPPNKLDQMTQGKESELTGARVNTPQADLKGHSDYVLSPTLDRVAGTTSWHMWVTVPNGECMGVIRMVLPTASFLPGCHMVGSRRGGQRGVL